MIEDEITTSIINKKSHPNDNSQFIDTSEFPDSIKKILKSLVFKAIEEEINDDNLTKSAANTDRFIFSNNPNMENIYLNIKESSYFSRIVYFLFCFNMISLTILSVFFIILSKPKNNSYCFNQHSNSFEICDLVQKCLEIDNEISQVLYIDEYNGTKLYNANELEELYQIQRLFNKYFYFDLLLTKTLNNEKVNYAKKSLIFPYNVVITITHNDNTNLRAFFKLKCNYFASELQIGLFITLALAFGNILYGFFADLFGRKRILELIMFTEFIGCLLLSVFTILILISGRSDINLPIPPFLEKTIKLNQYEHMIQLPSFFSLGNDIDKEYLNNFIQINQILLDSSVISNNFLKFKFIFCFLAFLCFTGVGSGFNISISLMFEECIHEKDIYNNYFIFFLSVILSYPFAYFLLYLSNSLWFTFIFISALMFIIFIFSVVFLYESPRYHFEYCQYDKMTYILMRTCDKRYIKPLFKEVHSESIEDEVEKMEKNYYESFTVENCKLFGKMKYLSQSNEADIDDDSDSTEENDIVFSRIGFFFNIFSFYGFMMSNQKIKNNFTVLFCLVCISSMLYYNTLGNVNLILNNIREEDIISKIIFYAFSVISNFFFYTMIKFFGYRLNFFIGFSGALISSTLFTFVIHCSTSFNDVDIYYYSSFNIILDKVGSWLNWLLTIEYFFTHGVYFTLFLYLVKFSKTIYRCSFFGLIHSLICFNIIVVMGLCSLTTYNMIYSILISFMGIIITFFITTDIEDNFVVEARKVVNKSKK